ncbi:OLC1v1008617C1 [Oldenlandia corymbosa var. corymbosa]|uniref:OLC1v1008617C1 n=1 Tax=Oldenlandia corymbosa var. corymbosa TaxID=529605 RepID=A0AAV1DLZ2_OLDCO|nr:OLC1v1008617C1 [Oldenlandia corymbosa var. corymbosa]
MRVLKWTPRFNTEQESSTTPVWVSFEGLRVHRFNKEYLGKLSNIIGTPLKIDVPTLNMSRPSIARQVTYENLLEYCMNCRKIGHSAVNSRHGKQKSANQLATVSCATVGIKNPIPTKKTDIGVPPKPLAPEYAWGKKDTVEKNAGQANNKGQEGSTSGLTEKEKQQILTDVVQLSTLVEQVSRLLSNEKLSAILEKISQEENLKTTWENDGKIEDLENMNTQLVVYTEPTVSIPTINLSSRFDLLKNLQEDQINDTGERDINQGNEFLDEVASESDVEMAYDETVKEQEEGLITEERRIHDDVQVGLLDETIEDARLVVSDGEDNKKKRGRPEGSTKEQRIRASETRRSTKLLVYAKSTRQGRSHLWTELKNFQQLYDMEPWIVGGDYNVIHNTIKYEGSSQPDMGPIDDFNSWINDCKLIDLTLVGNLYTWKGTRQNGMVEKRLDRVLFNQEWLTFFPIASVHHLNRTTSDHSSLLLKYKSDVGPAP